MFKTGFSLIALVLTCTACATKFEVIELPLRNADLYPHSQTIGQATVAIDEIGNPQRAQKYFGIDLIKEGILPVNITISNNSGRRFTVTPADVLLRRGTEIIDPLPIESVIQMAKSSGRLNDETREQVDTYFTRLVFAETVLGAHDSYQGVLFFPAGDIGPDPYRDSLFRAVALFNQGGLKMEIVVSSVDEHQRIRFGPFSLANFGPFSYF